MKFELKKTKGKNDACYKTIYILQIKQLHSITD